MDTRLFFDHLVIGSGAAGLTAALRLSRLGTVAVLATRTAWDTNTRWAQGGVACVMDAKDSFEDHIRDTLEAGDNLCNPEAVRRIVERGPEAIRFLLDIGVRFTTRGDMGHDRHAEDFHLGREGGHHKRRVLHSGDITGEEIQAKLIEACAKVPGISIFEQHTAIDLITSRRLGWMGGDHCLGAYALDTQAGVVRTMLAQTTTLATGGCGKVYLYTSNPDTACGSGVAMAYRAHAKIANMEFYQFHPTILYNPRVTSFLISEAVRGEGGVLALPDARGKLVEFMQSYHPMGSLAPRDIVARAIDCELKRRGLPCAYIDIRHKGRDFLLRRFPNIYAKCLEAGVDMAADPVPVVPAAHYCCGGVKTDIHGYTGIPGLYAAGEVACTGLHGANRLASNSLLETLVVPLYLAEHVDDCLPRLRLSRPSGHIPDWYSGDATDSDELVVIAHNWDEIRRFMWDYVGIQRTGKRLERAKARIRNIRREIEKYYWDFLVTRDLIELRNLATVAELIIDSALSRPESRGLHFNADAPRRDPAYDGVDTILSRPASG